MCAGTITRKNFDHVNLPDKKGICQQLSIFKYTRVNEINGNSHSKACAFFLILFLEYIFLRSSSIVENNLIMIISSLETYAAEGFSIKFNLFYNYSIKIIL